MILALRFLFRPGNVDTCIDRIQAID